MEETNPVFYPDELGLLSIYRVCIWITQKRSVPEGFCYLGNYDIIPPEKEYVRFGGDNLTLIKMDLKEFFTKCYKNYNLKQFSIYIPEEAFRRRAEEAKFNQEMDEFLKNFNENEARKNEEQRKRNDTLTYVGGDEEMKKILRKGPKTYLPIEEADKRFMESYIMKDQPSSIEELKLKAKLDRIKKLCEEFLREEKTLFQKIEGITLKQKEEISEYVAKQEEKEARENAIYYFMTEVAYLILTKYYTKEGFRKVL